MTKEALKLALEALVNTDSEPSSKSWKREIEAITAVKRALAQPEQEPVVCDCDSPSWCKQYKKCNRKMLGFMPYVAQPQRTWVGLTDGEVDKMILLMGFPFDWTTENAIVKNIVRNLEAKLKEKNS